MAIKSEYNKIQAYSTKDGSQIKELMHPEIHGNQSQSLAEACIPIGSTTLLHTHNKSEELYHIKSGKGLMTLGQEKFEVTTGDTICIPPGVTHR
ncbi:MAG: cupin domain-containing protein, partial [Desulfobacterales bacterium]